MTIDQKTLAAYADGELNPIEAARVERALADDATLAAQLAAHRVLRATLTAHFAPIVDQPVPDRLTSLVTNGLKVVDLATVRGAREAKARRVTLPAWGAGGALAASLVIGLGIGQNLRDSPQMITRNGALVADGSLDGALTGQLASAQDGAAVRILVSFRQADGTLCRGFDGGGAVGIACRENDHWAIRRTQSAGPHTAGAYRQAGSAAIEILDAAQDMALGGALDAAQEKAARDSGWRPNAARP